MEALLQEIDRVGKKHANQGWSRTLELEAIRKDGLIVPVEVNYSFIYGVDERSVEILAVGREHLLSVSWLRRNCDNRSRNILPL